MNNWSPRTVRGLIYFGAGLILFKVQPPLTQALLETSLFWAGLSRTVLTLAALVTICMGVYLLATRYKK